jgi:hypothetical protein
MLALVFGLALTAVLLLRLVVRRGFGTADPGSMSPQWIAAWTAGEK